MIRRRWRFESKGARFPGLPRRGFAFAGDLLTLTLVQVACRVVLVLIGEGTGTPGLTELATSDWFGAALGVLVLPTRAQNWRNTDDDAAMNRSMFRYMDEWPDPNVYRNAAGMPGPEYWQQQADYVIQVELDTVNHRVTGSERVTYHNNSPDTLREFYVHQYLNAFRPGSAWSAVGAGSSGQNGWFPAATSIYGPRPVD